MLVFVNTRGGYEYGTDWHNNGRLLNKINTFDDMHAAADFVGMSF